MTKMEDFQTQVSEKNIATMIDDIEKAIEKNKTGRFYPWVSAILDGEFSINDRDTVARIYLDEGGWYGVFHMTSSENGERPGLTELELFTSESYAKWNKAYDEEYKSKGHLFFKDGS